MAGFLARRSMPLAVFPDPNRPSDILAISSWLTVAGTAPDSHRLPS